MKTLLQIFTIIIILLVGSNSLGNVCFTIKEAEEIYKQLNDNEKIIKWQRDRWNDIVNTQPKITYDIIDNEIIIQTVEFPVKDDTPLIYEVKIKIIKENISKSYFPFTLSLCGVAETGINNYMDTKLGIQLLNFYPLHINYVRYMGIHLLIGVQSSGFSLSWMVFKHLKNTRLHLYTGMSYKMKKTIGIGVSLNF